jgi:hypothetical protein
VTSDNDFTFKIAVNAPAIHPEWIQFHCDSGSFNRDKWERETKTWLEMISHLGAAIQTSPGTGWIQFEWENVRALIEESARVVDATEPPSNSTPPPIVPPQFAFECIVTMVNGQSDRTLAELQLNRFVYALFLAMNLSQPGCFDLNDAAIPGNSVTSFGESRNWTLSCEALKGLARDWATPKRIPFARTWHWISRLDVGLKPLAPGQDEFATERVLLALLHALSVGYDPAQLVWLSHALESMFYTPRAAILETLQRRIHLVLKPGTHQKTLRKAVRDFYDLRSKFVHGDLPVLHPAVRFDHALRVTASGDSEGADEANLQDGIKSSAADAIAILIFALQDLVERDWKRFDFSETLAGVALQ